MSRLLRGQRLRHVAAASPLEWRQVRYRVSHPVPGPPRDRERLV